MSLVKQAFLTLLVVLMAAGGWYAYQNYGALTGTEQAGAPSGEPGGRRGGGGGPGGRGGGPGGFQVALNVVTAATEKERIGSELSAIGTAEAARAVTLYPQVTGIVAEVAVEAGDKVETGALLLRLDNEEQEIAVDRARIALEETQAALGRAERLSKSQNITEVALSQARVAVQQGEIELRSAELQLERRSVRAPFAGVVGIVGPSIGDLVTTSSELMTLDDLDRLKVNFNAPEQFAATLRPGTEVTATAAGLGSREMRGEVSAVDSRVAVETRAFRAEATLDEGIEDLKPGMAVTVRVTFPGQEQTTVPSLAIQWDREGSYVWRYADGAVAREGVRILGRRSGTVIVAGDLAAGDEVVIEGLQRLRDGMAVTKVGGPGTGQPAVPAEAPVAEDGEVAPGAASASPARRPASERDGGLSPSRRNG